MSLEDILSQNVTEITRPPPMPAGTYLAAVAGPPQTGTQPNEKQTPYVEYKFNLLSPMDDVDREKLAEIGGIAGKQLSKRFFVTEDSVWGLDTFHHEHLGIDFGKSRKEAMSEAPGRQVLVVVKQQPSKDGSRLVSFIDTTAKP